MQLEFQTENTYKLNKYKRYFRAFLLYENNPVFLIFNYKDA